MKFHKILNDLEHRLIRSLQKKFPNRSRKTYSDIASFRIVLLDQDGNDLSDADILLSNCYGDGDNDVYILNEDDADEFFTEFRLVTYPFWRLTLKNDFMVTISDCGKYDDDINYVVKIKDRFVAADIYSFSRTLLIVRK